jgi:hypothetical protein
MVKAGAVEINGVPWKELVHPDEPTLTVRAGKKWMRFTAT